MKIFLSACSSHQEYEHEKEIKAIAPKDIPSELHKECKCDENNNNSEFNHVLCEEVIKETMVPVDDIIVMEPTKRQDNISLEKWL